MFDVIILFMYAVFIMTVRGLINVFFQGGLSALMLCCEAGNSEMAKLLLNSHANPDLQQSVCTLSL